MRHKLRTFLALIGIVIGVAAISTIGILGSTVKEGILKNFEGISNYVIIYPHREGFGKSVVFKDRDVNKLKTLNCKVIPISQTYDVIYIPRKNQDTFGSIYGIHKKDIVYLNIHQLKERSLTENGVFADSIFLKYNKLKMNDVIKVKNNSFKIINSYNASIFTISSNSIIMDYSVYKKLYGGNYSYIILYVANKDDIPTIKKEVENMLNSGRDKKVDVVTLDTITSQINNVLSMVSVFLMSIGSISLLVAGIGIGNVMLMGVIERTKEIGIMRSIGASKKDIMLLFLYEAFILGLIGSVIGVFISLLLGGIVAIFFLKMSLSIEVIVYMVIGILFGVGISIISAIYPAYKASNLNPIDALRS